MLGVRCYCAAYSVIDHAWCQSLDATNPTPELTFERAVEELRRLRQEERLFIRIVPPLYIRMERLPGTQLNADVDVGALDERTREAETLLAGALFEKSEDYVSRILGEDTDDQGNESERRKEELQRKLGLVREAFIDDSLQRRYELKRVSKASVFSDLDWDLKIKLVDSNSGDVNFPYSTVKLIAQREFGDDPFSLFSGRAFESIQVNFTSDEAAYVGKVMLHIANLLQMHERGELGGQE